MAPKSFRDRVLSVVSRIPRGQVMTYGEVARRAGNPKAARAVGAIMNKNRSAAVPCHRVVAANGIGGFFKGVAAKRAMLRKEGALTAALQ